MIEFAGLDLRSATAARPARDGKPGADPSGFAALLAALGSLPADTPNRPVPARLEPLALPGGKARQAEVLEALETALAGLTQPAEADAPVVAGATPEAGAQVAEDTPEADVQHAPAGFEPPADTLMTRPAAEAGVDLGQRMVPTPPAEPKPPAAAAVANPEPARAEAPATPRQARATLPTPEVAAPAFAPQERAQDNITEVQAAGPAMRPPVNTSPSQTRAMPQEVAANRPEAPTTARLADPELHAPPTAAKPPAPLATAPAALQPPDATTAAIPAEPTAPRIAPTSPPARPAATVPQLVEAVWYRPAPQMPQTQQPATVDAMQVPVTASAQPGSPIAPTSASQAAAPAQPALPAATTATPVATAHIDLPALAARLDATLQQFDASYGADTRALIARNAAALPAQALAAPIETPQQFVAMARSLLGLAAEPAPQDSRVIATDGNTAPSVAALIGRSTAAPRDPVPSQLPAGAERIAAADLAPPRPAEAAAPQTATAAPQPQGPSFAANLAAQVKGVQLTEGTTRVELAPRGLGGLEIDVATDDQGGLKVIIRAENPSVLQALRDGREALLAVLRDSGAAVQDSALGFENFGRDSRQQTPQDQPQGEAAAAPAEDDLPADAPAPVATPLPEGQVDIIT